ncbi:hypothetical protein [Neobacillus drentensis]|uniref:hypothetical protein n=1 Tax=Neobacillus drentensis TaxID=220684 RepID=UPI000826B897|nr:hypothetical protein [Neobacillus drentensis]
MQKTLRKFKSGESVGRSSKRILNTLKLDEMYDKFMTFKKTEALAPRTIREYYILFDYLKGFLGDDPISENVTLEDFRVYIPYI